jgi:hypothetical protein
MHAGTLPVDLDMTLMLHFLRELLFCSHYVVCDYVMLQDCTRSLIPLLQVTMFTIRWLYEVMDYFGPPQRAAISRTLTYCALKREYAQL